MSTRASDFELTDNSARPPAGALDPLPNSGSGNGNGHSSVADPALVQEELNNLERLAKEDDRRRVQAAAKFLPRLKAEQYRAIVLDQIDARRFRVGMVNPESIDFTDSVARAMKVTTFALEFEEIKAGEFNALFSLAYTNAADPREASRAAARDTRTWAEVDQSPIIQVLSEEDQFVELDETLSMASWNDRDIPPTTRDFTNLVLLEGFNADASDIHVESARDAGHIRFRCDSMMYQKWVDIPEDRARQLVNALASMAGVRAEKLKFESFDSAIKIKINRRVGEPVETEYRITFTPATPWPECVLRINKDPIFDLERVGLLDSQVELIKRGLALSEGLILITGPTGSGKSNTLQAIYAHYEKDDSLKIIEFGDPIEFISARRTQLRITPTFSWEDALRSALRSDPNVISPAECRDATAASALLNAALTGHIVPTSFHTNDIGATFTRLTKLGIPHHLQSEAVNLIVSQRLIRLLCKECKEVDESHSAILGVPIYRPGKCVHCYGKGYKGQTAVAEVLLITSEIRDWIASGMEGRTIVENAVKNNWMIRMQEAAQIRLKQGETSLMEIERVMKLQVGADSDTSLTRVERKPQSESVDGDAASESRTAPPAVTGSLTKTAGWSPEKGNVAA